MHFICYLNWTDEGAKSVKNITERYDSAHSLAASLGGAFMSSRGSGDKQIWVVGRDGRGLKRLTSQGNNEMPSWSR